MRFTSLKNIRLLLKSGNADNEKNAMYHNTVSFCQAKIECCMFYLLEYRENIRPTVHIKFKLSKFY